MSHDLDRRAVLGGLVACAALTGCAGYGSGRTTPAAVAAGTPLAAVADVPVGGGLVLAARDTVLVRPDADTIRAYTATCTHQGCSVTEVVAGEIRCVCHGSTFALDGTVTGGPAPAPLAERAVAVVDGAVTPA